MNRSQASGVLVAVAHGSESLETVTILNVLRRAEIDVTVASTEPELTVAGTRGVRLIADLHLFDVRDRSFEMIVLPGGEKGADALARHAPLIERLHDQNDSGRMIGAICAAPALTLATHHFLDRVAATCYPAFKQHLPHFVDKPVVHTGHFITSQGPGTALDFALDLVERLAGSVRRETVANGLLH